MMTKKVFKILVCAVFMVILCAGSAFAADGFTDAEKEKLLTDRSARSALHKTIEMMPLEEFKQYKPVIESAVFYDNAWLDSATTGYVDNIRVSFAPLTGYEKYKEINMPAGFSGYVVYAASSKNGEYKYITTRGFMTDCHYDSGTSLPCYYAFEISKDYDEKPKVHYLKLRYYQYTPATGKIYSQWSEPFKAVWPGAEETKKEDTRKNFVEFEYDSHTFRESSTTVKITAEKGAKIYYTTDGSTPTTKSKQYTKSFSVKKTTTIKAIAVKNGKKTKVVTVKYTAGAGYPSSTVNIVGYKGKPAYKVTLEPYDSKTTMYYTTDGSKPTKKSKKYTKTIYLREGKTLRVRSYKSGRVSSTTTISLPEMPDLTWKSDGWKGDDYGSGELIEGNRQIAGQFCDHKNYTRKFYKPGMSIDAVDNALNSYIGYVYGRRFFSSGIATNPGDLGSTCKTILNKDGKVGINVFSWRKRYDSDAATNSYLNMAMESFYFFTEDKDVAYALFGVVDYLSIYGSKYTTVEKIESFGFDVTKETDTSIDMTMNDVKIHWEWGDDISGNNFYFN